MELSMLKPNFSTHLLNPAAMFGLAVMLVLGGCATPRSSVNSADRGETDPELFREDLTFPIVKGVSTVEIENRYGEISVRDHPRIEVGVHGVGQSTTSGSPRARVVSSQVGDTLRLSVELPGDTAGSRYDLGAYVPASIDLVVRGTSHRVDARKRAGPLTVSTTTGNINASSQDRLQLSTESGTIKAVALDGDWIGHSDVRSVSGRILMVTPLSGNLSLDAQTGGALSTDFGLTVRPRDGGGHRAAARYGSGASELAVSSGSGEVILEQAVLLEEDSESSVDDD
jgi:hypothetical protein